MASCPATAVELGLGDTTIVPSRLILRQRGRRTVGVDRGLRVDGLAVDAEQRLVDRPHRRARRQRTGAALRNHHHHDVLRVVGRRVRGEPRGGLLARTTSPVPVLAATGILFSGKPRNGYCAVPLTGTCASAFCRYGSTSTGTGSLPSDFGCELLHDLPVRRDHGLGELRLPQRAAVGHRHVGTGELQRRARSCRPGRSRS